MEESLLNAPRNLNEPVRCKVSAFRNTRAPVAASSTGDEISGVRSATPARRCAAASTSAAVGAGRSAGSGMGDRNAAKPAEARRGCSLPAQTLRNARLCDTHFPTKEREKVHGSRHQGPKGYRLRLEPRAWPRLRLS